MKKILIICVLLLIGVVCIAGRIDNRLYYSGTTTITTDESGNGTVTITFPTAFSSIPEVLVVEPLYNVKGIYGVKNSQELLLAKGKQPMGSISTFATGVTGGAGYTLITDKDAATGSTVAILDNYDGKTKVADATHGLTFGNIINFYNSDTAKINGFFSVSQVQADTFVIDRAYTAVEYVVSWQVMSHDLADGDLIHIYNSTNYNDSYYIVSSSSAADFEINETYAAETNTKTYWVLLPSIITTTAVLEVVNCDVKGGTVSIFWIAVEKR